MRRFGRIRQGVRLAAMLIAASPLAAARGGERLQLPGLAADHRGNFVVVWQGNGARGGGRGITGRRFGHRGPARAPEFEVNTFTTGTQGGAAVGMDAAGNFVVIWAGDRLDGMGLRVYGRRYKRDGTARGGEFRVSDAPIGESAGPWIRPEAAGGFLITWPSGTCPGIVGRRYDAAGLPRGAEFVVDACDSLG